MSRKDLPTVSYNGFQYDPDHPLYDEIIDFMADISGDYTIYSELKKLKESMTKQDMIDAGLSLDIELPAELDVVDEDWLSGVSCNMEEPELCESCQ